MKKKKKKIIIIIIVIILLIGIITGILLFNNMSKEKTNEKAKTFEGIVEKRLKDGTLEKELSKALPNDNQLTKDTEVKIKEIDIDSDNEKDLAVYTDTKTKYLILLEVDVEKEKVKSTQGLGIGDEKVLGYTYSKNDDKNYWFAYSNGSNNKFIIEDTRKSQLILEEDFNKDYYIIEDSIIEDFIDIDLDKKELDKNKLKDTYYSNDEVLKKNNITQEEIKEKANEVVEESQPEEEAQPVTDAVIVNGHSMPVNKKCQETANPLYNGLELHGDGTCILGSEKCTWSQGMHDFAQDTSSAGTKEPCIIVKYSEGEVYFSSWKDNVLSDGDSWECKF